MKRVICTEFSSYIKQDILILPQAGSILALLPDREAEDSNIKEIFARIVDRTQREYGIELRIGAGNSRAYLDEVKDSRNEASSALRAAEVSGLKGQIFFTGIRESIHYFPMWTIPESWILIWKKKSESCCRRMN